MGVAVGAALKGTKRMAAGLDGGDFPDTASAGAVGRHAMACPAQAVCQAPWVGGNMVLGAVDVVGVLYGMPLDAGAAGGITGISLLWLFRQNQSGRKPVGLSR